jgi:hypothetical protein
MTTLIIPLTPQMARQLAKATDILGMPTNADCAREAIALMLQSVVPQKKRGRRIGFSPKRKRG